MKERGPAPATIMNLVSGFGFTECAIKLRDSSSGVIPMKDEWSGWFRFSWGILGSFSNGLSSLLHSFLRKSKEFSSKSSPKYSSG